MLNYVNFYEEAPVDPPASDGEVRGTLLSPDQVADWGNGAVLVEKQPVSEADTSLVQKPEEPVAPEPPVDPPAEPPVVDDEDEPEPQVTVQDPGEYQANDYSFETTVFDVEGKNGKTVKVSSIEQWEKLLDDDANFGSASQLLKAQRLATKMESGQERDYAEWQSKKGEYDEAVKVDQQRTEATNQMAAEINYLVSKNELPPVAKEYQDANWSDPEVAKQPGIKEQIALLTYMRRENKARVAAGLKPMTSVLDAWNSYQLDESKRTAAEGKVKAGEARRVAGAKVAGSSPAPVSTAPKGIAVGRGGSLRDLGNAQGWGVGGS